MLKNLTLTLKFLLLPAIALIGMLLFVSYTYWQLANNDVRLVTLETHTFPILEKTDASLFQYSRLPGILNNAVAAGEMSTLDEAKAVLKEIFAKHQELKRLVTQDDRLQELDAWHNAVQVYAENAMLVSEKIIKGNANFEDLASNVERMATDLGNAEKLGGLFRERAYEDFKETLKRTRTDNDTTTKVGIALSIILVLAISITSIIVIRGTMANIRGVISSLEAIASGDGDLTRRVNVKSNDEIGEMIQLFNRFIDKLQGTIRQIIEAANPLGEMSKELYGLTQSAQQNSDSQQGHTESISRDIQTMTNSIQEVARRSQQAAEEADATAQQTVQAQQNIGTLSSSVSELGSSVMGAVKSMEQLEEETQQVGSVLTVIRSIAEQTNLLALNAAIEAARAGEQGRGFAVVADEVRNLASKTAASTAEIQTIIQRLQSSANSALSVMTSNGEKAQASIERSVEATQILKAIAGAVGHINQLNAGIAEYTREQIGLSNSIQKDTHVLQQDAQATAQSAEATARLGEQLVSTGDHLRAATVQFRV